MRAGSVIIGTGQAGFQTAASLREQGYQEPITLIGEEPHIPYQRPPLSKGFQLGQQDFESIELRPEKFYLDHRIELVRAKRVAAIDRATKRVTLGSGAQIPYEKLVLAVGARNRVLPIRGAELDGVLYLRTLGEAIALKERLASAKEIVVIGGGFIGLELASVARAMGKRVTVLEALPRLMSRAVAPVVSEFYEKLHTSNGVKVLCGAQVSEIAGASGRVQRVLVAGGAAFPADLVLVGIGIVPNVELARDTGLRVSNGVAVNDFLQSEDPDIFAIGDCAEHPCVFASSRVRLESVQNAAEQAQCAAATIAGRQNPYRALPWFWTDQYDVKLQMAGISQGHDQIVMRGKPESLRFSVFYFKEGRLAAIDSINRPVDHMMGRRLIAAGISVTPEEAADESVDLKLLAQKRAQRAVHPPA
jgi:3-phenylpropionate/trans-cinnamate dioxygenase ferredoxin reductase component